MEYGTGNVFIIQTIQDGEPDDCKENKGMKACGCLVQCGNS